MLPSHHDAVCVAVALPIILLFMGALCFLPALGASYAKRRGLDGAYHFLGLCALWVIAEAGCALSLAWLLLDQESLPQAHRRIAEGSLLAFAVLLTAAVSFALVRPAIHALADRFLQRGP